MALYTTADLLRRAKVILNRPSTDEAFTVSSTDDVWYDFLTEAQQHIFGTLAAIAPTSMYGTMTLLTTVDGGMTWTFGTDVDGAAISPYGHFELYPSQNAYPDAPLQEGIDFLFEGTLVRGLYSRTMAGPYARFITPPNVIASGTEPTLLPKYARGLIAEKAAAMAASERLKQDPSPYEARYQESLKRVLLNIKTAAFGMGAGAVSPTVRPWYRNSDFG